VEALPIGISREKREGADVIRAYDCKVAPVDRRDLGQAQAFSRRDDGSVNGAQWQVTVPGNQFSDPQPVSDRHWFDHERSVGQVTQEPDFGLRS
jgi:hypothetical protein